MVTLVAAAATSLQWRLPSPRMAAQSAQEPSGAPTLGICSSYAWPALQAELDVLPVFALASKEGEPLLRKDLDTGVPKLVVFADLFRAEAELANANKLTDVGLTLLPIGLGDAFARVQAGTATLIPSQNELAAAGLDPNSDGEMLPFFGCTKMMKPRELDPSQQAMPLFMSSTDARAALDEALAEFAVPEGMKADAVGLNILAMPLGKAIKLIVSGEETRFEFIAPSKSVEWVRAYAERSRKQDGEGDAGSEEKERQEMFEQLIAQRRAVLGRTGGALPGDGDS